MMEGRRFHIPPTRTGPPSHLYTSMILFGKQPDQSRHAHPVSYADNGEAYAQRGAEIPRSERALVVIALERGSQ